MEKKLLIIGAGGHGRVAEEVALSMKKNGEKIYQRVDFLDDTREVAIGKVSDLEQWIHQYDEVFVAIGDNKLRRDLFQLVEKMNGNIATLIHPTAYVSPTAVIEKGSIVEAKALLNTDAYVKKGCIISVGAIVDHNTILEEFCHVNTGTICCAGSVVKADIKTSAGEIVKGY